MLLVVVKTSVSSTSAELIGNMKKGMLAAYVTHHSGSHASTRSLGPAMGAAKYMGECCA